MPTGAVSGTLEVRVNRYTPDFDRKTVEEALRLGGYPRFLTALRNAPEVGQLVLGGGQPYAIRYAREKVEAGGRTIVVVTDRPVFFLGGGRADAKPRAGYEVAVRPDSAGWQRTGQRDDGGGRPRAPRWRRRRAARRLRRTAHRADQRHAQTRSRNFRAPAICEHRFLHLARIKARVAVLTIVSLLAPSAGPLVAAQAPAAKPPAAQTPTAKPPTAKPRQRPAPPPPLPLPRMAAGRAPTRRRAAPPSSSTSRRSRAGPTRNTSSLYAAVSYTPKGAKEPALGTVKVESDTSVALDERLVSFSELKITEPNFPDAPARCSSGPSSRRSSRRCRSTSA